MMKGIPTDRFVFRMDIEVRPDHIDALGHVNNVVYLQWVQDASDAHWKTVDPALQAACKWVVLRHEIDYKSSALPGDQLEAFTWVDPSAGGVRSTRHVWIQRKGSQQVLVMAATTWCLLDPSTDRPRRIMPEIDKALGLK